MQLQVLEFEWDSNRRKFIPYIFCIDLLRVRIGRWDGSLFMLYHCYGMWGFNILYLGETYRWLKYKILGE